MTFDEHGASEMTEGTAPRPNELVARLVPYEWEALTADVAAAAGIPEADVVRFDLNTTAWPPVAWERTVAELAQLPANEYPHPSNEPLRSALAHRLGVAPERVVVTCGADEALYLVARAYLGPGRKAVAADPTFSMFRVVTDSVGATYSTVPVDSAWGLPLEPLLQALADPAVGVVWLCNPNNPTGQEFDAEFLGAVLEAPSNALVVVDEAYAEISGRTLAAQILDAPNAVLVRTFSKGYGLAGARVGYLAGSAEVTDYLDRVRPPQNLTVFGLAAAGRALEDETGLRARIGAIVTERSRLQAELARRGWELVSSAGNFVLGRPPLPASEVAAHLLASGLVVRTFPGHPRLDPWLRVTVRAPSEDDLLLRCLDAL